MVRLEYSTHVRVVLSSDKYRYALRLNYTKYTYGRPGGGLPTTKRSLAPLLREPSFSGGRDNYLHQYAESGFLTLQASVNDFILNASAPSPAAAAAAAAAAEEEPPPLLYFPAAVAFAAQQFPSAAYETDGFWTSGVEDFFALLIVVSFLYPLSGAVKALVWEKEAKVRSHGARAMGLLGRGGPVPRGRARSLEAGFLRLCDTHARAHAGGVVVLVFLASLPPRPPRWIARWACSDETGLVSNSVARGGPPAAAACCAPAHARPQARTHVGGPVVCGLGDGAGCRMHSGGGAQARRHGGASRGMGPRAAHAGRGLSVRSWSLSSAPAAPATQRGSTPPPRVVGGWRDVARAAAVECERSDMEAPAVRL